MKMPVVLTLVLLFAALPAEDYIAIEKHQAELGLAAERYRELEQQLELEKDIGRAYRLLALELFADRPDDIEPIRKRLSFLVMDVLPKLPHKKDHRLFKEFVYVDTKLREIGKKGILE